MWLQEKLKVLDHRFRWQWAMEDSFTLTNFSEGAKQPTHSDSRIQPRAWLLLEGFWVSCLQI